MNRWPRTRSLTLSDPTDTLEITEPSTMHADVAGLTHVGMRRTHNEDNLPVLGEQGIFVVADGMGGHASGEVASRVAVEEMAGFYLRSGREPGAPWPLKGDSKRTYEENRVATAVRLANKKIFELAHALGAAVGASRAAVDSGWIPYKNQVGLTGRSVRPKLYVAVGISGQIQHLAGMSSSGTIVAINTDKDCPLMQIANIAVQGDLNELLPLIIDEVKRRRGAAPVAA